MCVYRNTSCWIHLHGYVFRANHYQWGSSLGKPIPSLCLSSSSGGEAFWVLPRLVGLSTGAVIVPIMCRWLILLDFVSAAPLSYTIWQQTFWSSEKPLTNPKYLHDKRAGESRTQGDMSLSEKGYMWQAHSQHHPKWRKAQRNTIKIRKETALCNVPTPFQHRTLSTI